MRRHHMYDQTFQRAFKRAVEQAGITKPATPHTPPLVRDGLAPQRLRHSNRAGSARPFRRLYDDDLHACGKLAVPECAHRLMRCRPSLVRGRAAQVNPRGFTTPARRPSVPHRTAGCGKSSLRPLMAGSSPSLPDGSNPSAAIVQSASDVQCSRLLKTTNSQKGCYRRFDLQPIG